MVLYLAGGTKRYKSMLGIPEIADNYCLEGSKIKISLKCFGMLCFALLWGKIIQNLLPEKSAPTTRSE